MKKFYAILCLAIASLTQLQAQAPQGFNYQATVRNSAGNLIVNTNVFFRFNIMQGSQTSPPVFTEIHLNALTDDLGQVNLVIGQGTATTGAFSSIDWSLGSYYLGIELDTGNDYVAMGTTQLLSVPYALYAENSGNSTPTTPNLEEVLAENNSANNQQIKNLQDPTEAQDAVTLAYILAQIDQINLNIDHDGDGFSENNGDCDDTNAQVYSGAEEICDGLDNDCDGLVDEGAGSIFYQDSDGDGFGGSTTIQSCGQPSGYVVQGGDCDDSDATINPNAVEVCDGIDNNCDGVVDEGLTSTFYQDSDGDGFGGSTTIQSCGQPSGYVVQGGDCDDSDATINPNAVEVCDGIDNNCDGVIDVGLTLSGVISNNNQYAGFGVSASGANDGFIDITVGGGTTNYSYAWSTSDGVVPSDQETNQNLTDLVAGTYTVVITDSNDCTITEDYIVTEPGLFAIEEVLDSHVDVLCYDDSTGALEVAITGGATPYTYVLTGPVTETEGPTPNMTYNKTGLPTGDYTVTAIDANGTVVDIEITILQPDAIDITETISEFNGYQISCFGESDGTIDIVTTGGGGPSNSDQYTYEWTLGGAPFTAVSSSTLTNLQGLGPGIYKVTVTDDVGCTYTETYEITEPTGLTLSGFISDYNGFGVSASGANDGFIDITVGGGTTNYSYAWSTSDGVVPSDQETNQNLTDLVAGTYTVVITDSNDCTITEDYVVTVPE